LILEDLISLFSLGCSFRHHLDPHNATYSYFVTSSLPLVHFMFSSFSYRSALCLHSDSHCFSFAAGSLIGQFNLHFMQVVIASLGSIVKPGLSCCCHWDLTLVIVMGNFFAAMEVVVDLQRRWCLILVLGSGFVDHRRQLCQDPQVNYYSLASLDYMIA
jgi:hypothetical protein